MDLEKRYGEPEYSRLTEEISQIQNTLAKLLSADGKALLTKLCDAYAQQNVSIMEDIFTEGFCTAVELAADMLQHK